MAYGNAFIRSQFIESDHCIRCGATVTLGGPTPIQKDVPSKYDVYGWQRLHLTWHDEMDRDR